MKDSMRRLAAALVIMTACCGTLRGQDEHILALTGASEAEELDETVIERYEALRRHPIHINSASKSGLISCGLFSVFQVAAIDDWRRSSGDILSVTELGSIDGFNPALAKHMAPFIDFSSKAGIGRSSLGGRRSDELSIRGQVRKDEGRDMDSGWGVKYRHIRDGRGSLAMAARNSYGSSGAAPDTWSLCGALEGKRHMDRLIIGDFNSHFGQGLAMWSGFSLSGAGTVDAFCKRPSGVSPTWSFASTSYRGAAAGFTFGKWTATGMMAFPGLRTAMEKAPHDISLLPAANLSWLGKHGQIGLTGYAHSSGDAKLSVDTRWHLKSIDIFGEAAADAVSGALAGIGGVIWSPQWQHSYAVMLRSYPGSYTPGQAGAVKAGTKVTDEKGATLGMKLPWLSLTADAAWFPSKGTGQLKIVGSSTLPLSKRLSLIPHISLKLKEGGSRADMRADLRWSSGALNIFTRTDVLRCTGWAWLQYAECGYKTESVSAWLRGTVFRVDNWADRIYVYERDAPGSFNVPAYYGRGVAASAVCGWKRQKTRLHLRASIVHYASDKPARVELRCQYSLLL